jgi:hypothetical protein
LEVRDESNHYLLLPVDIIDMLNKWENIVWSIPYYIFSIPNNTIIQ